MQETQYRDITIKFMDIQQHCQVPSTTLVNNYFFAPTFQQNHQQYFQIKTQQQPLIKHKHLSQLTHYDVRLNSHKPSASIRNAQIDFATYPPSKRLCFYIIDETPQADIPIETTDYFVEFQLILGHSVQRSQSVNVKGLTTMQLNDTLKQMFYIEKTQPIRLIDQKANITVTLSPNQLPQKKFRNMKLNKIGVIREYTAG